MLRVLLGLGNQMLALMVLRRLCDLARAKVHLQAHLGDPEIMDLTFSKLSRVICGTMVALNESAGTFSWSRKSSQPQKWKRNVPSTKGARSLNSCLSRPHLRQDRIRNLLSKFMGPLPVEMLLQGRFRQFTAAVWRVMN